MLKECIMLKPTRMQVNLPAAQDYTKHPFAPHNTRKPPHKDLLYGQAFLNQLGNSENKPKSHADFMNNCRDKAKAHQCSCKEPRSQSAPPKLHLKPLEN